MDIALLASLMRERHLKQADLVRATGKTSASVSEWFSKGVEIRANDALVIADLLGVSVRYLITGSDDGQLLPREKKLLKICSDLPEEKFDVVLRIAEILSKE